MRRSEVCALTWDDIDLKNKTVRVDEKQREEIQMGLNGINSLLHTKRIYWKYNFEL